MRGCEVGQVCQLWLIYLTCWRRPHRQPAAIMLAAVTMYLCFDSYVTVHAYCRVDLLTSHISWHCHTGSEIWLCMELCSVHMSVTEGHWKWFDHEAPVAIYMYLTIECMKLDLGNLSLWMAVMALATGESASLLDRLQKIGDNINGYTYVKWAADSWYMQLDSREDIFWNHRHVGCRFWSLLLGFTYGMALVRQQAN